jgi:hypothetical protein
MPSRSTEAYQTQAVDIHPAADRLWFELWRSQSIERRWQRVCGLQRQGRGLALWAARQRLPATASELAIAQEFARAIWGDRGGEGGLELLTYGGDPMSWQQDQSAILAQLHELFEQQSIPYLVTGGQAAIIWGEPRFTTDLDILLAIEGAQLSALTETLEAAGFYVAEPLHHTINIIHRDRIDNADLIVSQQTPFECSALERRYRVEAPGIPVHYIATAEDVVLAKLLWRRGSRSEKQWRDCLGIVKIQGDRLDLAYLATWADRLSLQDDLRDLLAAGGL